MDDLSGHIIKGYELQASIGTGGFGAVYRAYQPVVGREVAIKVILPRYANQPEFIRRFEYEAHLVARLEHPHIVPLYDYWRDAEGAFLVMRWLRAGSLAETLKSKGAFSLEAAARLLDQIASGLAMAHQQQVIHRDLKPANILLDEEGNGYLTDFGIAKEVGQHEAGLTETGMVIGSPDYIAPEQAKSEPVTPQTDIYALGVLLYEMLTGAHPFPNASSMERLLKHINDPIPMIDTPPSEVADDINAVIQRATAKHPSERFATALDLAAAFREAAALQPARPAVTLVEELTQREQEILAQILNGRSNKEIAAGFVLEIGTVKWHLKNIYRKLGAKNRVQAMVRARELPLVTGEAAGEELEEPTLLAPTVLENPYKGLRAFQEADAADFFGRQVLIDHLLARLANSGETARFLAVVGPSGSGKSSVVKAGLIPALRRGALPHSDQAFIVEMFPGTHPLEELEAALLRAAVNPPPSLIEQLQADERGLMRAVKRVLPADENTELILIIDQFEEVFTLLDSEASRAHFLDSLLTAIQEPRSRLRVIITLRADFYDRPLLYEHFGLLMRKSTELVLPLSSAEIEAAIVQPAQRVGAVLESGLVQTILNDVSEQPGALPLLQYALTELFERREGRTLTLAAYHAMGGVLGALAQRADELFDDLDEDEQETARQLFLRLVTLGEGTEDTRRRVRRAEFGPDGGRLDAIIDAFGAARLLLFDRDPVTRGPTLEVAHEALIRQWGRLRDWLNTSREDVRLHRRLTADTAEWIENHRDPGFLAMGARLTQYEAFADSTDLVLNEDEHTYLDTSLDHREALRARDEARKAHELTLTRRAAQRLRYLVGALTLFLIVAAGLSVFAFGQRHTAQEETRRAEKARAASDYNAQQSHSLALAAYAQQATDSDDTLAIALALEAVKVPDPPFLAQQALAEVAYAPGPVRRFQGHLGLVFSVAFSPDSKTALSGANDATLILWDVATGDILRRFQGHEGTVTSVAFSPDGTTALSGANDATLILWDVATGDILRRFQGHEGWVNSVAFSPDGKTALSGSEDSTLILWDVATGEIIRRFQGHEAGVTSVAFSPNGETALSGSLDNTLILWDMATGDILRRFQGHEDQVYSVAFGPDGETALSGSRDRSLILWDVATGEVIRRFQGHKERVYSVAFSPNGETALSGSLDNTLILWNVATGDILRHFQGHGKLVHSVAFSPDGMTALSGSDDRTLILWDIATGEIIRRFQGHEAGVTSVAFSPNGETALSGSLDNTLILWDVATGDILRHFQGHKDWATSVAFSPDGETALSGSTDNTLILWDIATGEVIRRFQGHGDEVRGVAFSPNSKTALSGSWDSTLILWDIATGEVIRRFQGHEYGVNSVVFSPDGETALSGSVDSTLILWDLATGAEIRRFQGHEEAVTSVAFSPDGKTALSGSSDNTLILWDVATGDILRRFQGHEGPLTSVAFSPDGTTALSGSDDGTLILWNVATGEIIRRFQEHEEAVMSVAFSPDGKTALSASIEGTLILWRLDTLDELIQWTYDHRYAREFTCLERQQYRILPLCP